jgi:hypothetical protein
MRLILNGDARFYFNFNSNEFSASLTTQISESSLKDAENEAKI